MLTKEVDGLFLISPGQCRYLEVAHRSGVVAATTATATAAIEGVTVAATVATLLPVCRNSRLHFLGKQNKKICTENRQNRTCTKSVQQQCSDSATTVLFRGNPAKSSENPPNLCEKICNQY